MVKPVTPAIYVVDRQKLKQISSFSKKLKVEIHKMSKDVEVLKRKPNTAVGSQ